MDTSSNSLTNIAVLVDLHSRFVLIQTGTSSSAAHSEVHSKYDIITHVIVQHPLTPYSGERLLFADGTQSVTLVVTASVGAGGPRHRTSNDVQRTKPSNTSVTHTFALVSHTFVTMRLSSVFSVFATVALVAASTLPAGAPSTGAVNGGLPGVPSSGTLGGGSPNSSSNGEVKVLKADSESAPPSSATDGSPGATSSGTTTPPSNKNDLPVQLPVPRAEALVERLEPVSPSTLKNDSGAGKDASGGNGSTSPARFTKKKRLGPVGVSNVKSAFGVGKSSSDGSGSSKPMKEKSGAPSSA
ncbi:hypothetical protein F5J12DRAFT_926622 [Pisolithus orientalis]|uniref:uncharacterized protein n=1 Tax=Pisolithus orientalis TaxID=936130 RepID=UPI00222476F7|nr:uncharacterized protein F5J12DRAFT_926622 [Pisolithus orientalis]KAI6010710.1 hypothetical protein F5J12DRAFT_926622 [Pisolithus orientalis]